MLNTNCFKMIVRGEDTRSYYTISFLLEQMLPVAVCLSDPEVTQLTAFLDLKAEQGDLQQALKLFQYVAGEEGVMFEPLFSTAIQ